MKHLHLFFSLAFCALLFPPHSTQAQSLKQREASTAIISQFYQGKYTFNAKATRQVNQKEVLELITENNQISTDVQQGLIAELSPGKDDIEWRGVLTELILECGEVPVVILGRMDTGSNQGEYIRIPLPPDNACSKLRDGLAELLYGDYVYGTNGVKRCEIFECVTVPGSRDMTQCIKTILLTDGERVCYNIEGCSSNADCSQDNKAELIIFDVVFMNKN